MNDTHKNNILIVDDERQNLEILSNILSPEYTILTAKSSSIAFGIIDKYMPDIILLDIIMPEMNGFEMLEKLKASEKTQKIPVIIITGLASVQDEEKGLALQAADFITKPFSANIVKARVRHHMQIVNQMRALEQLAYYQSVVSAAEEKSKFFARMSHEMRTPLNAVIGLSELTLESGGLSEEARENVENISNAGASLLGLVNDILDISKIESGKFRLVPVEYIFPVLISEIITQCIMWKGEKSIEFKMEIDENIPSRLFGDDLRVKQILINLLSNAFKYTKEGTVELIVKSELSGQDDGVTLTVTVKDTGVGIQSEELDKLFAEYNQIDVKSNRTIVGTGLGLSITKMIVELMGGIIEVESEYGKGSIFTVKLPQKHLADEIIGSEVAAKLKQLSYHYKKRKSRRSRVNLPYAHVLVVDDVLVNLDVARGMMKPYGMKIDCVSLGQLAVDAIREEKVKYNAIFMDHMMPEMDGIEATRIIREEIGTEYARNIPIIAFTANAISGNEEMFLSKGFQAFISKPVDIGALDAVINKWIRDEEIEKTLPSQQIIVDGEVVFDSRTGYDRRSDRGDRRKGYDRRLFASINGLDISRGQERFSGDWEIYLQILQSFSSNTKLVLETIKEVNSAALPDYAIIVHGIKSSCRGICAEAPGNQAEALEKAAKTGDLEFVMANNQALIDSVSSLITELDNVFSKETEKKDRPKKDKPYEETLSRLVIACEGFDAAEIDVIMKEIEAFEYTADENLVSWLRENISQMNYTEIAEKLREL